MSFTVVPVSLRPTIWAKKGWRQMMYESALGHFLNSGAVYRPSEFEGKNTKGQSLVYSYTPKLLQPGLGRGSTLDGNEEALNPSAFTMAIGITRVGVLNPNDEDTVEAAETDFEFENTAQEAIKDAMVEKLDFSLFNQLAGNNSSSYTLGGVTYTTDAEKLNVTGQNTIVAPSTDRIIRAGAVANDQSLTSANKMTLTLVD